MQANLRVEWEVLPMVLQAWILLLNTTDALYRPIGLALAGPTVLYMSATHAREKFGSIMYKGNKTEFGAAELAVVEKEKIKCAYKNTG